MPQYLIIIEPGPTSCGAYVPDLPGCIAVGETKQEAMDSIRDAIELHLEDLRLSAENNFPVVSTWGRIVGEVFA